MNRLYGQVNQSKISVFTVPTPKWKKSKPRGNKSFCWPCFQRLLCTEDSRKNKTVLKHELNSTEDVLVRGNDSLALISVVSFHPKFHLNIFSYSKSENATVLKLTMARSLWRNLQQLKGFKTKLNYTFFELFISPQIAIFIWRKVRITC